MNKERKKGLVPALRFPEFKDAGEWEKKRLGEIGQFIGGGTPNTSVAEYWDGAIQWFTPTEIKQQYLFESKRTISNKGLQNSSAKLLPKGTLLLSTRATVGDIGIAGNECATNQGFQSLLVHDSEINLFWYYSISQNKNELFRRASGSTFLEIVKTEINKVSTLRPSKEEQQKIADCLSSLDELIAAHTKKHEALQSYKKGLMQNLFPAEGETVPALRFPEFEDAGEWELKELGKIANFYKGKGISKADVLINGRQPCIRYGELYTVYGEVIDEVISRTDLPTYNLFLSDAGDVIIPSSGETKIDIATAACVVQKGIALGGDLNVIRSKQNGFFLSYYLNGALKYEIAKVAQGDTVAHLYKSNLESLELALPPKPKEQQKIADCLSSLDDLIGRTGEKIEDLKAHKKGLMQQLFPAMDEVAA